MSNRHDHKSGINRRDFLKRFGLGVSATGMALVGCTPPNNRLSDTDTGLTEVPVDRMTYRVNPKSGEKVSLLGYGCMRWPMKDNPDGEGEIVDQEAVNRFSGTFPDVLTVLSGMTYMEHLQDNIRTYSPLKPLTAEDMDMLEETAVEMISYPSVPCTACEYCMPCPYGIDIPRIFAHYNKCINEGNAPASSQNENYRKARRAFLVGYDRSVPRLRQASHCIGCNQCAPHCPQSIKIPDELHSIDRFVENLKQKTI